MKRDWSISTAFVLALLNFCSGGRLRCPEPPMVPNASFILSSDEDDFGEPLARYTCDDGFFMEGSQDIICDAQKGLWLQDPPKCIRGHLRCPEPPMIPNASIILSSDEDHLGEPLARYTCDDGFVMEGSQDIICDTQKGIWLQDPPKCNQPRHCPQIKYLKNGYIDGECCAPESKLEFICEDEKPYELIGPSEITCYPNGSWSAPVPECKSLSCADPGAPINGWHWSEENEAQEWLPESTIEFGCNDDYTLVGEDTLTCGDHATWSAPRPKCKPPISCEDFIVEHGHVRGEKSGGDYFVPNDYARIICDKGYRIDEGSDMLECGYNGEWEEPPPQCNPYNCTVQNFGPHVVVREFKNTNETSFPVDTQIYFECEKGYVLEGAFSTICKNGGWFGRSPKCHLEQCGRLTAPENGWVVANSTLVGAVANFGCFQGFQLLGDKERRCYSNGQWSGEVVRCVPLAMLATSNSCVDPGTPDNSVKVGNDYSLGKTLTFTCNPGYHIRGVATIRCQANKTWSASLPVCIGKYYFDRPWDIQKAMSESVATETTEPAVDTTEGRARSLNLNLDGVRHVVYFLLDSSASIGSRNFNTSISLAKAITKKLTVTEDGHRVGVIRFNSTAEMIVNPLHVRSTEDALHILSNISYVQGGTNLNEAINTARKNMELAAPYLQMRGEKVKFSLFLISDGKANLGGDPSNIVKKLRESFTAAEIYCIGITGSPNLANLDKLASAPIEKHVFVLRNYNTMQWLVEELTNGTIDYSICGATSRHTPEKGLAPEEEENLARIFGGIPVKDAWPWMVELSVTGAENEKEAFLCGASIIAPRWILTAAHCFFDAKTMKVPINAKSLIVRLGLTDTKNASSSMKVDIKRYIVHPRFPNSIWNLDNDIALIELKDNITYNEYARPVCLPPAWDQIPKNSSFYKPQKTAIVIGWGQENDVEKRTAVLKQTHLTIKPQEDCRKTVPEQNKYTDSMMCAKGQDNNSDACKGDSGGPLMQGIEYEDTIWTQVGIVSWGARNCNNNSKPGVYTNVAKHVPWLEEVMNNSNAA